MVTLRRATASVLGGLAVAGCAGPSGVDPTADRPYLVAVDPLDEGMADTLSGTLVVERECVLLEDEEGPLLPLFTLEPTRFGPRDGGALTIDTGQTRLRVGEDVTFRGEVGQVTDGLRSRYPGVDATRCGVRRFALIGEVLP